MSDISISMNLPLDDDGFLRRECPHCMRQFKWNPSTSNDDLNENSQRMSSEQVLEYYCPYCHQLARPDAWWTQEQLAYAQGLMQSQYINPLFQEFTDEIQSLNGPGSFINIDVQVPDMEPSAALSEPNDMIRVNFPCHPGEPVKVDENWDEDVSCLVCGTTYPFALVRELPS